MKYSRREREREVQKKREGISEERAVQQKSDTYSPTMIVGLIQWRRVRGTAEGQEVKKSGRYSRRARGKEEWEVQEKGKRYSRRVRGTSEGKESQ